MCREQVPVYCASRHTSKSVNHTKKNSVSKIHIFWCMVSIVCVAFRRWPLTWTHTPHHHITNNVKCYLYDCIRQLSIVRVIACMESSVWWTMLAYPFVLEVYGTGYTAMPYWRVFLKIMSYTIYLHLNIIVLCTNYDELTCGMILQHALPDKLE